jgi:hypothetical protein
VSKVCQNPMFFDPLGLTSSEKRIPQVDENTERAKWLLDALESVATRPRQARYQAALRPDGVSDYTALAGNVLTTMRNCDRRHRCKSCPPSRICGASAAAHL